MLCTELGAMNLTPNFRFQRSRRLGIKQLNHALADTSVIYLSLIYKLFLRDFFLTTLI